MRARLVDAYLGSRPGDVRGHRRQGFRYGSGRYAANRELVEWMKRYNSDTAHMVKLSFYGTLPSEQETTESPRQALELSARLFGVMMQRPLPAQGHHGAASGGGCALGGFRPP